MNWQETIAIMNEEIDRLNLLIDRKNVRINDLVYQLIQERMANHQLSKELAKLKEAHQVEARDIEPPGHNITQRPII